MCLFLYSTNPQMVRQICRVFQGLGKLNAEELQDVCQRLRAVGFGPGHCCALRQLRAAATATWMDREGIKLERIWWLYNTLHHFV